MAVQTLTPSMWAGGSCCREQAGDPGSGRWLWAPLPLRWACPARRACGWGVRRGTGGAPSPGPDPTPRAAPLGRLRWAQPWPPAPCMAVSIAVAQGGRGHTRDTEAPQNGLGGQGTSRWPGAVGPCLGRPRLALSSGGLSSAPGGELSEAGVARESSCQCWDPVRGARLGKPPPSPRGGACVQRPGPRPGRHTPTTAGGGSGWAFLPAAAVVPGGAPVPVRSARSGAVRPAARGRALCPSTWMETQDHGRCPCPGRARPSGLPAAASKPPGPHHAARGLCRAFWKDVRAVLPGGWGGVLPPRCGTPATPATPATAAGRSGFPASGAGGAARQIRVGALPGGARAGSGFSPETEAHCWLAPRWRFPGTPEASGGRSTPAGRESRGAPER